MKTWEKDLPRKQYSNLKKINQSQPWFEVYEVLSGIYAIYEPYQFQEVISYLICGSEKALLWDTGNGIGNMKQLVDELWNKEIIVLNSHCHFDHIGSNSEFDLVHVFDHPMMIQIMEQGVGQDVLDKQYSLDTFSDNSPIDYHQVVHRRCHYVTVQEHTAFDLGNRVLEVIYTPGHSLDSIMLVSQKEKLLFTGDTVYPAALYCFDGSDFDAYVKTMKQLSKTYSDYTLLMSHNEPLGNGKRLTELAHFFQMIQDGQLSCTMKEHLECYEWKDYSLIKK